MNNKQQILHIGGGEVFNSRDQYINYLKSVPLYHMQESSGLPWYKNYFEYLDEETYQYLKIPMPCSGNASYEDWSLWFERHFEYLKDGAILIGHSLGGIFLTKYLSEKMFPYSVRQLHLIAPPYDAENEIEQLADFKITEFPKDFHKNEVDEIYIYHSVDDSMVPISESEKITAALPEAQFHRFDDRGHFLQETFPELFENIKKA